MTKYYFDMDGTLADLYSVDNVFKRLDSGDATTYSEAKPINKYIDMLHKLQQGGNPIGIITHLGRHPKDATYDKDEMDRQTIINKKQWLIDNNIKVDSFISAPYGTNKYELAIEADGGMGATGVLVDDDDKVLATWFSNKIKATKDN